MAEHITTGKLGEEIACRYLKEKGYIIIYKGWRSKHLEVDVIVYDGDTLVFVEVKTRRTIGHGMPFEAVDFNKQTKLDRAANAYILDTNYQGEVRFDIISIVLGQDNQSGIHHIKDAFWPES